VKTFRDIVAWQKSMQLARTVYSRSGNLPDSERFGLMSQLRRAAVSIPSNIAEGFGRETRADFLRFLRQARGSLFEVQTQLELAQALTMLDRDPELDALVAETDRVLQGFIRGLEASQDRA
jgi:four helix bundle protein